MPSKKKKYNARFPPARIKKIMQTDEEVGKVAAAVPVIISRALELFIDSLITKASETTIAKNAKTLTTSHIKQTIESEKKFDFLRDLVASIPDHQAEEDHVSADVAITVEAKRPRGVRPRKPKDVTVQKNKRKKKEESESSDEQTEEADESEEEEEDEDGDGVEPAVMHEGPSTSHRSMSVDSSVRSYSVAHPPLNVHPPGPLPGYPVSTFLQAASFNIASVPVPQHPSGLPMPPAAIISRGIMEDDDYDT